MGCICKLILPSATEMRSHFCFGQRFFSLSLFASLHISTQIEKRAPFVCIIWHGRAKSHNIVKLTMSILHRFYVRAWAIWSNDGAGCDFIVSTELERPLCYTCVNDVNSQNHKKHEAVISWLTFVCCKHSIRWWWWVFE